MSITVNYKGEQIAQSTGNALTLNTAGKYMEADVILSASGGVYPVGEPFKIEKIDIVPTADITASNQMTIDATKADYVLQGFLLRAKHVPQPHATKTQMIYYQYGILTTASNTTHALMRLNGSYGTDGNAVSYSASTNIITIKPTYAYLLAGVEYELYLFYSVNRNNLADHLW